MNFSLRSPAVASYYLNEDKLEMVIEYVDGIIERHENMSEREISGYLRALKQRPEDILYIDKSY
jgi:outer membrane protein assembly factor BamD (BamD/ComL family)